jgi:quinoprotein dehydrogenase-associated probable ABC transporter substrate-binding protein
MSSAFDRMNRSCRAAAIVGLLATSPVAWLADTKSAPEAASVLRVCSDPNNLPFSNERGEGFENELATLLAREMGRRVEYTWFPQRRGFIRQTLKAERCDLVIGVPVGFELTATTRPYYRSSFALVSRRGSGLDIRSLDDPRLRELAIGIHAIGDDYSNVPPAHALARRGLAENLRGYSIYGDYSQPDPPRALIDAVARGEVDVAIAWGPTAGYFAKRSTPPLDVYPLQAEVDDPWVQMQFGIAMGLRREDDALRAEVQRVLDRKAREIRAVLERYGVPLITDTRQAAAQGGHSR